MHTTRYQLLNLRTQTTIKVMGYSVGVCIHICKFTLNSSTSQFCVSLFAPKIKLSIHVLESVWLLTYVKWTTQGLTEEAFFGYR